MARQSFILLIVVSSVWCALCIDVSVARQSFILLIATNCWTTNSTRCVSVARQSFILLIENMKVRIFVF